MEQSTKIRPFWRLITAPFSAVLIGTFLCSCQTDTTSGPPVRKPLSYLEQKYSVTVPQRFDFTCGAAALATLITHYWDQNTSEAKVLETLHSRYSKDTMSSEVWKEMQKKGFSLDDLIWAANKLGFEAQAASLPAEELGKIDGPIIVHVLEAKDSHFTVLRLRAAGWTYLSDPVQGAVTLTNEEFDRKYTGSALAVWKKSSPLPKAALLGRPYPVIDPSIVINAPQGNRNYYFKSL
jgi:predicted double-glycine peptidase